MINMPETLAVRRSTAPAVLFAGIFIFGVFVGAPAGHAQGLQTVAGRPATLVSNAESSAVGIGLNDFISLALERDPEFLSAQAQRDASVEVKSQALAGLLPSVSGSYQKLPNAESRILRQSALTGNLPWQTSVYDSESKSLTIRQPLVRLRNWATLIQSNFQANQAEERLKFAGYQATLRAINAYTELLNQLEIQKSAQAKVAAADIKLLQTERLRQAGQSSQPDVLLAKADLERARFELEQAKRELTFIRSMANELAGRPVIPAALPSIPERGSPYSRLSPEQLLGTSLSQNPEIIALENALSAARLEYRKNVADHAPTIDLLGQYVDSMSSSELLIGSRTKTTTIGIQVTVPIFSGGSVLSATRQAAANVNKAKADLNASKLRVTNEVLRAHQALTASQQQWISAKAMLEAAELVLLATDQQRLAGIKNLVDVEQARARRDQAQTDLVQARSQWLTANASIDKAYRNELGILFLGNP